MKSQNTARTAYYGWKNMVVRADGVRDMIRFGFVSTAIIVFALVSRAGVGQVHAQDSEAAKIIPPIVERTPLLREPSTPEQMFSATLLMVDLYRPDLATRYLEQFVASEPDDDLLIKLRDKYGTGDFLKLSRVKELQPRSTELLERLTSIAKKQAADPGFVDQLLKRITDDPIGRERAMKELRQAGVAAVPEILKKMSQPEMADHLDTMVIALTKMGNQVVPPLIGAIDTPQGSVRAAVIDVLGLLDAKQAAPYLWFSAFDETQGTGVRSAARRNLAKLLKGSPDRIDRVSSVEASSELRRLAKLYYRNAAAVPLNDDGRVVVWYWDGDLGTVAEHVLSPEVAALLISTRFARQALALSPEQPEPQRQYLASLLGLEVARTGWDQPRIAAPQSAIYLAMTAGEETVSQVLSEALEAGQATTAVAALEVLSQIGSREQLQPQRGLKSPVIAALNSPDSRVQYAAAMTVLKLDPKTNFRNSTRVVDILARSLRDPGLPRAIIIDSDGGRSTITSGFLTEAGYEGVIAVTGREGFELAATSAGIELIVVHVNCIRWELTDTLKNLRADARTAAIPVVVYGPSQVRGVVARLVARSAPAMYIAESASAGDFLAQMEPFTHTLKASALSEHERALEKRTAIYWLAMINSGPLEKLFDTSKAENDLSLAIDDPTVAINALSALSGIGSKTAQERLANVAVNIQMPESVREQAAAQLAFHIQRFSVLLSPSEIEELQEAWNAADNLKVKSALAGVIGSLRPDPKVVGRRLQEFKTPAAN